MWNVLGIAFDMPANRPEDILVKLFHFIPLPVAVDFKFRGALSRCLLQG
jgi:hypothetical protein